MAATKKKTINKKPPMVVQGPPKDIEDQIKKLMESYSKSDTPKKIADKRVPLEKIEIGKAYSFPYENGAYNKSLVLKHTELTPINNLQTYYENITDDNYYYDGEVPITLGKNVVCLVCDIVVRNSSFSLLHNKLLNKIEDTDYDNEVVIMIENKLYFMSCDNFKELAKEVSE